MSSDVEDPRALPAGANAFAQFLEHSPFGQLVGLRLTRIVPDEVELLMPFEPKLATAGDVVHGGAIGTLIDVAHGRSAQTCTGQRPGCSCHCEVDVTDGETRLVAKGLVVYRIG
jgi:acyl-coenzyme A thioesterase PaaI-like protein